LSIRPGRTFLVVAALVLVAGAAAIAAVLVPRHLRAQRGVRELQTIVADLRSDDADLRSKAAQRLSTLQKRGLATAAGLLALKSATEPCPAGHRDVEDGGALLVAAAAEHPSGKYAPIVEEHFPDYTPRARFWALRLLANMEGGSGADTILAILRHHAAACADIDLSAALGPMVPNGAAKLFPGILDHLADERLGISVAYLTYETISQGGIPDSTLMPQVEPFLALYQKEREVLLPRQRTEGHRWMWEEDYLDARDHAGLLLDLFGWIPSPHIRRELARALAEYTDPRLLTFAAASLVRLGDPVSPDALERIASHAEMRNTLYEMLQHASRSELFPARYRTQEAFAESAMVNWLVYPTELGQVPDEIELMKVVTTGAPGEEQDYFVFRFRMDEPHWAAKNGWMAGVAGGFERRKQPTTDAGGDTFSSFTAWDSKTPEEHVGEITDLIGEAWKAKAKEARGSHSL
jgi:hypothetical protein